MHFWQHCENFFAWSPEKSLHVRKWKKQDFFQDNTYILPQIVPLDTENAVFQTTLINFATKCQKVFALCK